MGHLDHHGGRPDELLEVLQRPERRQAPLLPGGTEHLVGLQEPGAEAHGHQHPPLVLLQQGGPRSPLAGPQPDDEGLGRLREAQGRGGEEGALQAAQRLLLLRTPNPLLLLPREPLQRLRQLLVALDVLLQGAQPPQQLPEPVQVAGAGHGPDELQIALRDLAPPGRQGHAQVIHHRLHQLRLVQLGFEARALDQPQDPLGAGFGLRSGPAGDDNVVGVGGNPALVCRGQAGEHLGHPAVHDAGGAAETRGQPGEEVLPAPESEGKQSPAGRRQGDGVGAASQVDHREEPAARAQRRHRPPSGQGLGGHAGGDPVEGVAVERQPPSLLGASPVQPEGAVGGGRAPHHHAGLQHLLQDGGHHLLHVPGERLLGLDRHRPRGPHLHLPVHQPAVQLGSRPHGWEFLPPLLFAPVQLLHGLKNPHDGGPREAPPGALLPLGRVPARGGIRGGGRFQGKGFAPKNTARGGQHKGYKLGLSLGEEEEGEEEKKDSGSYRMRHFRWHAPLKDKRYGGFMTSEHGQTPLVTLFKNAIIKNAYKKGQ
uniref:Opiodes neuropeptide domain-containing protein n=1 Tax=Cairina moschata TaxID=8855 RepID=A0A8C3BDU6_CAIMO